MASDGAKLYLACFTFDDENEEVAEGDVATPEGTFEIVVHAKNVDDALERLRRRLDDLARETNELGPIQVGLDSLVDLSPNDLARGAFVNYVRFTEETRFIDAFPAQGAEASVLHQPDVEGENEPPAGKSPLPTGTFWSGVAIYESKWKLYWCTTDDHDEDWFVVARNAQEAEAFHVDAEGYDEDEANAALVCVLPAELQVMVQKGWPSEETIVACGGEFVPYHPQDGADALREQMGTGGRAVRIGGRVYAEGDIVANTIARHEDPS